MPAPSEPPDRDAIEHAQLVMNAIARFETWMRPMFDSRPPDARARLSRELIEWLAASPDSFLRAALLDRPCSVRFFEKWATAEDRRAVECIRPSEFFAPLCAKKEE